MRRKRRSSRPGGHRRAHLQGRPERSPILHLRSILRPLPAPRRGPRNNQKQRRRPQLRRSARRRQPCSPGNGSGRLQVSGQASGQFPADGPFQARLPRRTRSNRRPLLRHKPRPHLRQHLQRGRNNIPPLHRQPSNPQRRRPNPTPSGRERLLLRDQLPRDNRLDGRLGLPAAQHSCVIRRHRLQRRCQRHRRPPRD